VTSNLASGVFFNAHNTAANVGGGVPNAIVGNGRAFPTAHMMHRQSFQTAAQRPASSLQMLQRHPSMNGAGGLYTNNNMAPNMMLPQQNMHTSQRGISQQLPPSTAVININPQWSRMGGPGMVAMQGGRLANIQSVNPLGTVTVGGTSAMSDMGAFGNRNRLANTQPTNPLGTVTVGGTAMSNSTVNRGNIGAFGNRNRLGLADAGSFANRGRISGAPPRPPMLPMSSTSSVTGRDIAPTKEHHTSMRGMQSSPSNSKMGVGAPTAPNPSTMADFEDGPVGTVMDFGAENPIPEVALTTDLVTLSVHEERTFDGVELALHPDVFTRSIGKKKVDGKEDGVKAGDLVEIRVWIARPGMAAEITSQSKPGSILKSKIKAGTRPSLHSRNTSLATVSSSISNTSLMNTPRPLNTKGNVKTLLAPPLPKMVGGDGLSTSFRGSPCSASEAGMLYGESLIGSSEEAGDGRSGILHGEHLLETPKEQAPAAVASNLSSVFSGASIFLQKMAVPSTYLGAPSQGGPIEDCASMLSHSRDSSLVTNSTTGAMHSRDSSLISTGASWMNALSSTSGEEANLTTSPSTLAMEPVFEGLPQLHPFMTNLSQHSITSPESQVLPMRRDGSLMAPSTTAPPPPPHPLCPSNVGSIGSGTSTPSSHHSSPQNQLSTPVSTPLLSSTSKSNAVNPSKNPSASVSQRPPVAHSADSSMSREQLNAASDSSTRLGSGLLNSDSAKDRSLSSAILKPDVTPNPRQRASTADAPAQSDLPNGDTTSSHIRNNSIAMTGTLASNHNLVPTHRRYRSNVQAASTSESMPPSSAQSLHPSVKGSTTSQKATNESDASENVNDILQKTHFVRVSFVMPVSKGSLSSIKSGARTQVSLLRQIADLYDITAYDTVTVTQITPSKAPFVQQSIAADFLTITFKDQFVSRGDMYNFQRSFLGSWVYESKRLTFDGIRTNTKVIRHGDHVIRSGLISEDTKLTFRSRSARIIWLVQMSSEMWDFASPYEAVGNQKSQESSCKIYFDKFLDFVVRLFDKWKKLLCTHNLTVVFFSRTYIRRQEGEKEEESSSAVHVDSDGRMFEDHYKIVIENETNADRSTILRMKQEFVRYPKIVKWDLTQGNERTPSTASQGNVLEAINITLNLLHLHYIDRDLHRTGNSIVIITPGNGVFEIEKNLAGITKQRMMDHGIGSDMLSLSLPPLHVAPFFLYKEKGTSSAEEIQGFDDWKTYFEVPHWMNLSFVDYDNEEEAMLFKEHLNDDDTFADATPREKESVAQTWNASNGFLERNTPDSFAAPKIQPTPASRARQKYKHLISDRGFEDISQACRPRNRDGSGLPVSLAILLRKTVPDVNGDAKGARGRQLQKASSDRDHQQLDPTSPQHAINASRSRYLEWGAVDFDDFAHKRLNNSQQTSNRSFSGSQSSPSSSFNSIGSYRQNPTSQLLGISHLQSTTSLSNSSMTTLEIEEMQKEDDIFASEKGQTLSAIQKLMTNHDKSTFSSTPNANHPKNNDLSQSLIEDGLGNSVNEPLRPASPMLEGRGITRSQSAMFPVLNKGGIETALLQYDVTRQRKNDSVPRAGLLENYIVADEAAGRSTLAVSPLSIGMPCSLDRRNQGLRPSVMRLVAPDAIGRASRLGNTADGFQPLDTQRTLSFRLSQAKSRSRDSLHNQKKTPGKSAKENRLGGRRNSLRDKPKENGVKNNHHSATFAPLPQQQTTESDAIGDPRNRTKTLSPHRIKSKKQQHGRKLNDHHSYRRRKPWVLNPFRQEDEDEVLAKRTHNRRRWSHVFPLGEDEFKRHAGPNWKSLCQPAILPMTIDFHPSPQDLEDQAKFSVKQYSVTLPPMNETTYKSHTELLDDLLIQRMRQDYQIVPRNIIQQSARRDVTDNMLEATLSMGHKIQRLSYNPSNDSVDVVQYYARFAEDETPQTYRYLLWSALRQDYESVVQTFTKYTLPYKWNELDMLLSGDAVTTILEGMRYPRISFVIIPDPFLDSHEEKEYLSKFQRLVEYFSKIQRKDESKNISIEMHMSNDDSPQASSGDKRFVVDLSKRKDDKHEWMELVHDSNCDTRRTFRITILWLVAVASKIDNQAQLLHRRCSQFGLKLVSVPHYSCLRSCFMNPVRCTIFFLFVQCHVICVGPYLAYHF